MRNTDTDTRLRQSFRAALSMRTQKRTHDGFFFPRVFFRAHYARRVRQRTFRSVTRRSRVLDSDAEIRYDRGIRYQRFILVF